MKYDVFISHASEDKIDFVKPLAQKLDDFGLNVWYDEFTLKVGDSLSKSIDKGLLNSRYGIVVFSKSFFKKRWSDYELRGLVSKEIETEKVILPIWHNITKKDVIKYSPSLADKLALTSSSLTIPQMALKILEVVKPDVFANFMRYILFKQNVGKGKTIESPLKDLKIGPIRHKTLPASLIIRLKIIHKIFEDVFDNPFEETLDDFKRDLHPNDEIVIWEKMAYTYLDFVYNKDLSKKVKMEVFSAVFLLSMGSLSLDELKKYKYLSVKELRKIVDTYKNISSVK